ncbi:hypothetical protein NB593_00040 [Vibrio antiquarius]|nr:hypothetical protein [Vibrio antiquarius]
MSQNILVSGTCHQVDILVLPFLKNSLFVTLNGNRGVYKYNANSGGFEPSNSGLPTYMGETTINVIVAEKNCLRVKIFGDFY